MSTPLQRLHSRRILPIVLLALAVAACSAVFAALWAVLLRPMPFVQAERVVAIYMDTGTAGGDRWPSSYPDYLDFRAALRTVEDIGITRAIQVTWSGQESVERLDAARVSTNLPAVLGLRLTGPGFGPEASVDPDAVIVSERLARRVAASSAAALGERIVFDGRPRSIVGVWPEGSSYPTPDIEAWVPLAATPSEASRRGQRFVRPIARLRDGVTPAQLEADLNRVLAGLAKTYPATNTGYSSHALDLRSALYGDLRPSFALLGAVVLALLMIAMTNATSLQLAAQVQRRADFAVRGALGASRRRLASLLAQEALVTGACAGTLGLVLGLLLHRLIGSLAPPSIELDSRDLLNLPVLAVTIGVALCAALATGLLPMLFASRDTLANALRADGRSAMLSRLQSRVLGAVVILEVAFASALMIAAGLLAASYQRVMSTDPGFASAGIGTFQVGAPPGQAPVAYYEGLLDHLRRTPGVSGAALTHRPPLHPGLVTTSYSDESKPAEGVITPSADFRIVSSGFFEQLRIPLLAGRDFGSADRADSTPVTIVSRTLAELEWPGQPPLSRRLRLGDGNLYEVVGVVADVRMASLETPAGASAYTPLSQSAAAGTALANVSLLVRTQLPFDAAMPSLRDALRKYDGALAPGKPIAFPDWVASTTAQRAFAALLVALFGGMAIVLALGGVYGVLSYRVALGANDIAVRLSFGATPRRVVSHVLGAAGRLLLGGLAGGLALAAFAAAALRASLYGVDAWEPRIFAASLLAVACVALAAAAIPALRAAAIDPMRVLRGS